MTEPLLDEPISPPLRAPAAQRIFVGLEIVLWLLVLLALFLKLESWEGGSEILIIAFTSLAFLYLLLPIVLLGSRGWKQHLGAHAIGFALVYGIFGLLFSLQNWEYAQEMVIIGLFSMVALVIPTTVLWLVRRSQPGGGIFYRRAVLRLIPVTVVLLWYFL